MKQKQFKPNLAHVLGFVLNGLAAIAPRLAAKIAFSLFCTPRPVKVKPVEAAFLATADVQIETIAGQKTALYHWGFRGPIILMAHGWESHSGRWRKIAPRLVQAGYQVIAVDAPAHGRTGGRKFTMIHYAEILRAVLLRFGPVDTVIGHSVGGAAAIWAMGTASPASRPRKAVIMGAFSALEIVMEAARWQVGANQTMMNALDEHMKATFGHPIKHFSIADMAGKLEAVSGLVIHDKQDCVTPFRESEKIHADWPHAHMLATEGLGHGLTAPAVNDAVLDFVLEAVYC